MVKVIFLQNINHYKTGEVKDVAGGYARNFLIPKGIATLATKENLTVLEAKIKKLQEAEKKKVGELERIAEKIVNTKITLEEEVNEEGNMYGSVTAKEISEALKAKGFETEPSMILVADPIKTLGDHEIKIALGHGVETNLKISVIRKK